MKSDPTKAPASRWADKVKQFFGYRCAFCGSENKVEAHHIVPRSVDESLSCDLTNGCALCRECHKKAHGGSYYRTTQEKRIGVAPPLPSDCQEVVDFLETSLFVLLPEGEKEQIAAFARSRGESLNGFVNRAIDETIKRDSET